METAEAPVIVGGGIVGSSLAWHLTEAGCRNMLVLERESQQGKGSAGKSMVESAQFSTEVNIRMSSTRSLSTPPSTSGLAIQQDIARKVICFSRRVTPTLRTCEKTRNSRSRLA